MNIYDIAREASVSISTVSKYLNNKKIRPELKERVEAVIKKYNFVPNAIAQGLVSKSMKTVAVMVVDVRLPHYSNAAFKIDKILSPLGYRVIICNTLGDVKESIAYIDSLLNINVDGIVLIGSIFNFLNQYPELLAKIDRIPIVCHNGKLNTSRCISIMVNDKKGMEDATKYLINKGRKNIHYIQYLQTSSSELKMSGYFDEMKRNNLNPVIHHTDKFFDGGYEAALEIINSDKQTDAILCGEDLVAMGVIRRLAEQNIEVGKQVDVIGYNASDFTKLCLPTLTSVNNFIEESSEKVAYTILDMLKGEEASDLQFDPVLVKNESA